MHTLDTIISCIAVYPGKEIYFAEEVVANLNEREDFIFHAASLDDKNEVWLLDGSGKWHGPLKENQGNARQVIRALYKKLWILIYKAA